MPELVERITASIPQATLWRRLMASRVPSLDEGRIGRCPRCGRALPVFCVATSSFIGIPRARDERELLGLCLVHGWRSRHARSIPIPEVIRSGERISDALMADGWTRWSSLVRSTPLSQDDRERCEATGQALELLRLFGPETGGHQELEALVVSSARFWPAHGEA
jgi:hypothetical protein